MIWGICSECHEEKELNPNGLCIECDVEKTASDLADLFEAPPTKEALDRASKNLLRAILQLPLEHRRWIIIECIFKEVADRPGAKREPSEDFKNLVESNIKVGIDWITGRLTIK